MLIEADVERSPLGHSERSRALLRDRQALAMKVQAALTAGLSRSSAWRERGGARRRETEAARGTDQRRPRRGPSELARRGCDRL